MIFHVLIAVIRTLSQFHVATIGIVELITERKT